MVHVIKIPNHAQCVAVFPEYPSYSKCSLMVQQWWADYLFGEVSIHIHAGYLRVYPKHTGGGAGQTG